MDPSRFIPEDELRSFCQKWKIRELLVFGSTARGDTRPESDLDLLVTFDENARWTLWDHIRMEEEMSHLVGRKVELVTKRAIQGSRNEIRRRMILSEAQPFYAS